MNDPLIETAFRALILNRKSLLGTTAGLMASSDSILEAWGEIQEARDRLGEMGLDPGDDPLSDLWIAGNVQWAAEHRGHSGRVWTMGMTG